ncbi:hypothetical protein [Burkholderia sp. MSMB1835]|uniref:hypothetical protein n=1 Tax=Burkholderia sp. MSMB1835 TaxID=1637876 RepID=UPI0007542A68|nr:hypothetical protein [Burkholderia sp. MSMB1835]KVL25350.1 hypothetical protein WS96_31445 [Burkholderia sp. MSMB1835]
MNMPHPAVAVTVIAPSIEAVSQAVAAQPKRRRDVIQERLRARRDGAIPIPSPAHDYPASPAAVARHRAIHRATVRRGDESPPVDAHDDRFAGL